MLLGDLNEIIHRDAVDYLQKDLGWLLVGDHYVAVGLDTLVELADIAKALLKDVG